MDNELIEIAKNHMEKNRPTSAFFCLALVALEQLIVIARAQAAISERLEVWNEQGTLGITKHEFGVF